MHSLKKYHVGRRYRFLDTFWILNDEILALLMCQSFWWSLSSFMCISNVYLNPPIFMWCGVEVMKTVWTCHRSISPNISTHHLLLTPFWSLRILATVGDNCSQVVSHIPGFTSPGDRRSIENMRGHLLLLPATNSLGFIIKEYRY